MMGMNAKREVLTRLLPKTGQVTQHRLGDDGTYQAGWWFKRKIANNKTRFIAKIIAGDRVVVDLATGLMWAMDDNEAGCFNGIAQAWATMLSYIASLDFAGFTDWRVPNVKELMSIVDYSQENPSIDIGFFYACLSANYCSSTTVNNYPDSIFYVSFLFGVIGYAPKSSSYQLRSVRGGV